MKNELQRRRGARLWDPQNVIEAVSCRHCDAERGAPCNLRHPGRPVAYLHAVRARDYFDFVRQNARCDD